MPMLVIRKTDKNVFAFGDACSITTTKIVSPTNTVPFNALAEDGVVPQASHFEIATADVVPEGRFAIGRSHRFIGGVLVPIIGRTITRGEFVELLEELNREADEALAGPHAAAAAFLDAFAVTPGIEYADLSVPESDLGQLLAACAIAETFPFDGLENLAWRWMERFPA